MSMTRRNFIQSLGAVAGVEAVHRTTQALGLAGKDEARAASPDLPVLGAHLAASAIHKRAMGR